MLPHVVIEPRIEMAESAQQPRAGRPDEVLDQYGKATLLNRRVTRRANRRQHTERVGKRPVIGRRIETGEPILRQFETTRRERAVLLHQVEQRLLARAESRTRYFVELLQRQPRGEVAARTQPTDDRKRVFYKLTRAGEQLLLAEARRLSALVSSREVKELLKGVSA